MKNVHLHGGQAADIYCVANWRPATTTDPDDQICRSEKPLFSLATWHPDKWKKYHIQPFEQALIEIFIFFPNDSDMASDGQLSVQSAKYDQR